jgi:acyl-CoA reductase-like NAD-dependent aldehyde dehydrogenase
VQSRPLLGPGVLILGPFNYPVSLVLHPAIGALAAGNPVVIKPSEFTPHVATLLLKLISQYFTPDVMVCITGGIPETTQLLSYNWGRTFFTGSTKVGVIVAQAAAKTMTPVTLECGGKSICYIDSATTPYENDPKLLQQIAQRIIWSKTLNCGQTCAATDTVICDSDELVSLLVPQFIQSICTMFGGHPKTDSEIGRIVTQEHTQRLIDMIREVEDYIATIPPAETSANNDRHSQCRIVMGGSNDCDAADKYIAPTIIVNPPRHLRIMQEEIFGPILPIVTVTDRNDAIQYIRTMNGGRTMTPLCLYVFTNSNTVLQQLIQQVPAGSVVRNDCLIHLCSPYIPFGGLGTSGYGGAYHGRYTFDLFSHSLPVMYRPYVWPRHILPMYDWNALRCHPFTPMKKYITLHIAMRLPAFPVLHVRLVSMVLVLILAIFLGVWFGVRR